MAPATGPAQFTPVMNLPTTNPLEWLSGAAKRGTRRSYRWRLLVQGGFALLIVYLGAQFARFVSVAESRAPALAEAMRSGVSGESLAPMLDLPVRPPGVEGFLPISGLMGALDWIHQGRLNDVHPAATVLFLLFVIIALLLRKAFCSWICPIGFLSEALAQLGRRLFGRSFDPPSWLDIVLRGVKYLLLGFFVWAIFAMSAAALRGFIESPYNQVSDVKMYWFFARMSATAAIVLVVLAAGSVLIEGLWCRYLCPYGALLGLFSWVSPTRVVRDPSSCTDCGLCDTACMARLPVSRKTRIVSAECTGCMDCVASCPQTNALAAGSRRLRLSAPVMAAAVVAIFLAGYIAARAAGIWENGIDDVEYMGRILEADSYDHPR
jgi:ferredoxin